MGVTVQVANDIRINVDVSGEDQAARDLKKVGDAAEKAGDSIEDLGDQSFAAGKATEKAGDDFKAAGDDLGFLDKQTVSTRDHLKELIRELDRTGDTSLLKDIGKERRNLRRFESLAKELMPDVKPVAAKAGTDFVETLTTTASATLARSGPYVTAAVAALAIGASPAIASVISAAVLGGVGAGGIVGGVALAAQDPQVKSAAQQVGQTLLGEFQTAAEPFVDPLLRSLSKLESAGFASKLAPAFEELAKSVEPLADGMIALVYTLIPGLIAGAKGATPVFRTLAAEADDIGAAVSKMLAIIASDPQGAQDAIQTLGNLIEGTVIVTGYLVAGLTKVHEAAADVGEILGLVDRSDQLAPKFREDADALSKFGKTAEEAAEETEALERAINDLFGHTLGVKEATIAYEQAVDDLKEELTDGKRTLDENTQAGRDNWEAINNQARAINDLREANIRNKMPLAEANALYEKQFEQLRKTLLNLGYNKTAVNEYIDRLKNIPKSVSTTVFLDAFTNNASLLALAGAKAVSGKRAAGGPVLSGRSYIVGENGPEIVEMDGNGYVHNASQTKAMMSGASGGSAMGALGGGSLQVVVSARPGTDAELVNWLLPRIQIAIAGQGGIVQDVIGVPQR